MTSQGGSRHPCRNREFDLFFWLFTRAGSYNFRVQHIDNINPRLTGHLVEFLAFIKTCLLYTAIVFLLILMKVFSVPIKFLAHRQEMDIHLLELEKCIYPLIDGNSRLIMGNSWAFALRGCLRPNHALIVPQRRDTLVC